MKSELVPIFITASSMSFLAIRAVKADRFRDPVTDAVVLLGGLMPWFTIGLQFGWLPECLPIYAAAVVGLWGSGLLFFWSLLRYWLGPRFDNWERASGAMVAGVLAALGFYISFAAVFRPIGR